MLPLEKETRNYFLLIGFEVQGVQSGAQRYA